MDNEVVFNSNVLFRTGLLGNISKGVNFVGRQLIYETKSIDVRMHFLNNNLFLTLTLCHFDF